MILLIRESFGETSWTLCVSCFFWILLPWHREFYIVRTGSQGYQMRWMPSTSTSLHTKMRRRSCINMEPWGVAYEFKDIYKRSIGLHDANYIV